MEFRYLLQEEMREALTVAQRIEDEFATIFGRGGNALLEPYRSDDADYVVVGLGSLTYQLHDVIDALREEGYKVGVLGVRLYRPFPDQAVAQALAGARGVIVIDKALSYGYEGALCTDIKAALYGQLQSEGAQQGGAPGDGAPADGADHSRAPFVRGLIAGIGGREVRTVDLTNTVRAVVTGAPLPAPEWIGIKL